MLLHYFINLNILDQSWGIEKCKNLSQVSVSVLVLVSVLVWQYQWNTSYPKLLYLVICG